MSDAPLLGGGKRNIIVDAVSGGYLSIKITIPYTSLSTEGKRYIYETVFTTINGFTYLIAGTVYFPNAIDGFSWNVLIYQKAPVSGAYDFDYSTIKSYSTGGTVGDSEHITITFTGTFDEVLEVKRAMVYDF